MLILIAYKLLFMLLSPVEGSLLFESKESLTTEGNPVYNRISLNSSSVKDVWTMNQSHYGIESLKWDTIKIIVDKTTTPFRAEYIQEENGKRVNYKTSCFRCHSNGPRLIRPSEKTQFSIKERVILNKMNALIKSYGAIQLKDTFKSNPPLVINKLAQRNLLKAKSCTSCHDGIIREFISKENKETALFLVKNKQMPPWPYEIEPKEVDLINEFLYGF